MNEFRTIEIDFEVHKRIEMERRNFSEMPNSVLRRILKIDEGKKAAEKPTPTPPGRPWSGKGVTLLHGTKLRMQYNGRQHIGLIDNGEWLVEDRRFKSPSAAAGGVALTRNGKHTKLDGWNYWEARQPGNQDWARIKDLRQLAAI